METDLSDKINPEKVISKKKVFSKGQCHENFDLWFFFIKQSLLGPLLMGPFAYGFEFGKLFDKVGVPAVPLTPLEPPQRFLRFHCRISSQIRSHMQKGFNPLIRSPGGIV
jgi:hypothetical protein